MSKRPKRVPLRTCVACRQKRPQRDLLRVVRTPEGTLEVDEKGKAPGRGAYLCPTPACLAAGLQRSRLEQALQGSLSPAARARLKEISQATGPGGEVYVQSSSV